MSIVRRRTPASPRSSLTGGVQHITLQVLELTFDPNQASTVVACRGQLWRARTSSPGVRGQRRLLSETIVPPTSPADGVAGATDAAGPADPERTEKVPGETFLWEVLACVGYPLPKSFDVSSSLGGLGHLQLSR